RRSAIDAVGPFDVSISPCDDWDMWLRLSLRGEIAFLDRVVLNWRAHESNGPRQRELIFQLQGCVRRRLLTSPTLTNEVRRVALRANWHWSRHIRALRLARANELLA